MGMQIVEGIPKYLGLPMEMGRSKIQLFRWLKDKVQGKIN